VVCAQTKSNVPPKRSGLRSVRRIALRALIYAVAVEFSRRPSNSLDTFFRVDFVLSSSSASNNRSRKPSSLSSTPAFAASLKYCDTFALCLSAYRLVIVSRPSILTLDRSARWFRKFVIRWLGLYTSYVHVSSAYVFVSVSLITRRSYLTSFCINDERSLAFAKRKRNSKGFSALGFDSNGRA
jgi:hypothetical protein